MSSETRRKISVEQLEKACMVLKSIAHPVRMSIIDLLDQKEKMNVGELQEALQIEQATISHHLINMKDKKILQSQREGKNVYYSLREKKIVQILECVAACDCD
jgi:DNA-binding transcriptional ArsR family regulator